MKPRQGGNTGSTQATDKQLPASPVQPLSLKAPRQLPSRLPGGSRKRGMAQFPGSCTHKPHHSFPVVPPWWRDPPTTPRAGPSGVDTDLSPRASLSSPRCYPYHIPPI